jgi:hypothetical protein
MKILYADLCGKISGEAFRRMACRSLSSSARGWCSPQTSTISASWKGWQSVSALLQGDKLSIRSALRCEQTFHRFAGELKVMMFNLHIALVEGVDEL